jgi:uncharacterized cupin superfamily protein
MTDLASELGAQAIGANITRVPPGKAAFPFHHHRANEEHFFVLSGSGVLRWGSETYPVKPHDYVVNLPGGPEHGHQLINTGDEDLVYLAISTQVLPEVIGYPDSGKTGVRTVWTRDKSGRFLISDHDKDSLNYWDGEDGAHVATIVKSLQRS